MPVADFLLPVLFTLFAWWFSTGVIVYLDGLPQRTFRWSMTGATLLLLAALWGLERTAAMTTVTGAYLAFTCGLLAWAWQEMAFLMGVVAGPNRLPCPPDCVGWPRFALALRTILYHELAVLAGAAAVLSVTWNEPNQVGSWTYLVLWLMRQSAKLNVFLGVRNLSEDFLPESLSYLASFFRRRPMNLLFPVSVTAATAVAGLLWWHAFTVEDEAFKVAGESFVATLLSLAILEHWFLVLPLPVGALWSWSLRSRSTARPQAGPAPVARGDTTPPRGAIPHPAPPSHLLGNATRGRRPSEPRARLRAERVFDSRQAAQLDEAGSSNLQRRS